MYIHCHKNALMTNSLVLVAVLPPSSECWDYRVSHIIIILDKRNRTKKDILKKKWREREEKGEKRIILGGVKKEM